MYHLPRGASAGEAQEASGLTSIEWRYFKRVAKTLAEESVQAYPNVLYAAYDPEQQKEITNTINKKLAQHKIRAVGEDVVAWKMHAVIRDVIRATERRREQNATTSSNLSETVSHEKPSQPTTTTRPFDLLRDI